MASALVVDDSISVRKVVEKALSSKGIQVVLAADGQSAIERFNTDAPDLVVCDVLLPDMTGYQVCEHIRRCDGRSRTPVMLISGIVNSTVTELAEQAGANEVVRKPFEMTDLQARAVALLEGVENTPTVASSLVPTTRETPVLELAVSRAQATAAVREPNVTVQSVSAPIPFPSEHDLRAHLTRLVADANVDFAAIVDDEGFVVEAVGGIESSRELAALISAFVSMHGASLSTHLKWGALNWITLEYEQGTLAMQTVNASAVLLVSLREKAALGKLRYFAKKLLPRLAEAV